MDIRLEKILPPDGCLAPICSRGRGAAPGEEYAGPLAYLQRLEHHRCEFPFEELGTMAVVLRGWLDAGADQRVINDLEGLREAAERVTAYQEFQPRRCNRRQINRSLRAISQEAA